MNGLHTTLLAIIALASCAQTDAAFDCVRTDDCDQQTVCVRGSCISRDAAVISSDQPIVVDVGTTPAKSDAIEPVVRRGPCSDAVPPTSQSLVINEVLVNVPTGEAGDANGDGERDAYDDEFVELANVSDGPLDLAGVRILNGERLKFWFEELCLPAGESVVVFGGGTVGPTVSGSAMISETRFGFGNDGGTIVVTAPTGTIGTIDYENAPAESLTLAPQLSGTEWVPHGSLSDLPFSPGRCADGSNIETGCPPSTTPEVADAGPDG